MKLRLTTAFCFIIIAIFGVNSQSFVDSDWGGPTFEYAANKTSIESNSITGNTVIYVAPDFTPSYDFQNSGSSVNVINFTLTRPGFVNIRIYDVTGKTIDEIAKSSFAAGDHYITWNRLKVLTGTFYYSLITEEYSTTKKIQ